jgi:hypothetical protein
VTSLAEREAIEALVAEYPQGLRVKFLPTPHSESAIIECESEPLRGFAHHEISKVKEAVKALVATGLKPPPPEPKPRTLDPGVCIKIAFYTDKAQMLVQRTLEDGKIACHVVEEVRNQGDFANRRLRKLRENAGALARVMGVPVKDDGDYWTTHD